MRLLGVLCACLLLGPVLRAELVPLLTAETSRLDLGTGELVFAGGARAELGDLILEAREIRYEARQRRVTATGDVVIDQAGRRILAEQVHYELGRGAYAVTDLRLGRAPLFVSGSLAEVSAEHILVEDALVTFGEPSPWAPTFRAATARYYPDRHRMRVERARLGIGLWQPLPLPSTEISTRIPFFSHLALGGGYSNALGLALEAELLLPAGETWRLGPGLGLYSRRGVMFGPGAAYEHGAPGASGHFAGRLDSGYIRDAGDRQLDLRGRPVPPDRGHLTWWHHHQVSEALTADLALHYWSDSEVMRDFHPGRFFPVQVPDTYLDLQHTGPHAVLGLFLRAHPNPYHEVQERLPELTLDLLPRDLGRGLVHRGHFAAAVLRESPPDGGPDLRSDRADTYQALARPFTAGDWLTFTPLVGARLTHYARAVAGRDRYTCAAGELGADLVTRFHATFDHENPRWGIDGLRHLVTPTLAYRYQPRAERGRPHLPAIDRRSFSTYLDPLGLGDRRHLDDLDPVNTLRAGLGNRLQTRHPKYGSRDLLAYHMAADFHLDPAASQRAWSAIHSELRLTPAPWLGFELYHRLDPYGGGTRELNTALVLRDSDRWALRLATHHLRGDIEEYLADYRLRLNEVYTLTARAHYDRRRARFVEQAYGVRQVLGNRWNVGYELSFYDGPRRESRYGFRLLLEALAF
jgi:LPS-assembly protein